MSLNTDTLWGNLGPFLKRNNSQDVIANLWSALSDISLIVQSFQDCVEADAYISTAEPLYNIGGSVSITAASGVNGFTGSSPFIIDDAMTGSIKMAYTTSSGVYTTQAFSGSHTWDLEGTHLSSATTDFPNNTTKWKYVLPLTQVRSSLIYGFYSKVFSYDISQWGNTDYDPYYIVDPTGIDTSFFLHKYVVWGLSYCLRQSFSIQILENMLNIIYNNPVKLPGDFTYNNNVDIDPATVNYFEPLSTTHITVTTDVNNPFHLTLNITGNTLDATYDSAFVQHVIDNFLPKHLIIEAV